MANGWSPEPDLILNGNVRMNGRHPARALLEKLSLAEPVARIAKPLCPIPDVARLDGALGMFVSYILSTAIRPQPWLAVGAALAALGTLMGRKYRTVSNLRSNLYVIGLAASGGGKDHAATPSRRPFLAAGLGRASRRQPHRLGRRPADRPLPAAGVAVPDR